MNEEEILRELSSVTDELGALPADAFGERYPLIERQAELRSLLVAAQVEAGRDTSKGLGRSGSPQTARRRQSVH